MQIYSFELKRKLFHSLSICFPLLYISTSKTTTILFLASYSILILTLDIMRMEAEPLTQNIIPYSILNLIRKEEQGNKFKEGRLSGASFMAIGFFLSCMYFPKEAVIPSWLTLILSDTAAALFGLKFGRKLWNGKSIFGSATFLLATMIINYILTHFKFFHLDFFQNFIISLVVTLVEFFSSSIKGFKINDNLSIPLAYMHD